MTVIAGEASEVRPIVGDPGGKVSVAIVGIISYRLGKVEIVKNVCHFITVPRAVRIGLVFRLGHVVKPVAPARLPYSLLSLHHHIAQSGKGHIPANFAPQRFISLHAGIEQFN